MNIIAMVSDAGLSKGGTAPVAAYACCLVNEQDKRVIEESNLVPLEVYGLTGCGCNTAEFYAFLRGFELLAESFPGWSGEVMTDSNNTLQRFFGGWKMNGIPNEWIKRGTIARTALGKMTPVLLGGHPTETDLKNGIRWSRPPHLRVSVHNLWADSRCNDLLEVYRERKTAKQKRR